MNNPLQTERKIISVSDLNRRARNLLEQEFHQIWVEGEISNFVCPASGHWYFTLKDERAQVRCAMFTNRNRALRFRPRDGMHVILRGKASLYEGRGEYQLIAENLMQAGEGLLQQRFEELKQKLAQEGLFDEQYKKPLPTLPRHIGVITSSTGAAIRDILTVLERRFPAIPVSIIPTAVQGAEAADQIVAAINLAHKLPTEIEPIDVIIAGRGGGSLEDLWPFNEERVARAIFNSEIPVISAVGHEVDFTIADFVADQRAPTPSAAAELITPDQDEWQRNLSGYEQFFYDSMQRSLQLHHERINALQKRLRHPGRQLQDQAQRLDSLETRITNATFNNLTLQQAKIARLSAELARHQPSHLLETMKLQTRQLGQRLESAIKQMMTHCQHQLKSSAQALNTLSPLETLQRGYAIVADENQQIVQNAASMNIGDRVMARLAKGKLHCTVEEIESNQQ